MYFGLAPHCICVEMTEVIIFYSIFLGNLVLMLMRLYAIYTSVCMYVCFVTQHTFLLSQHLFCADGPESRKKPRPEWQTNKRYMTHKETQSKKMKTTHKNERHFLSPIFRSFFEDIKRHLFWHLHGTAKMHSILLGH